MIGCVDGWEGEVGKVKVKVKVKMKVCGGGKERRGKEGKGEEREGEGRKEKGRKEEERRGKRRGGKGREEEERKGKRRETNLRRGFRVFVRDEDGLSFQTKRFSRLGISAPKTPSPEYPCVQSAARASNMD